MTIAGPAASSMTLSIATSAGPTSSSPLRAAASPGAFALSLAQVAGPPAGPDDDAPPTPADSKDKDDARQDDAGDGNGLPSQADPSLLAAWLAPLPVPVVADATAPTAVGATSAATATAIPTASAGPVASAADPVGIATPITLTSAAAATPMLATFARSGPADPSIAAPGAPAEPPLPTASPLATAQPVPPAAASAIVALAAPVPATGVTITTVQAPAPADAPAPVATPSTASALQIDTRAAPVVALQPAPAPASPGLTPAPTTTSAMQAFGSAMRAGLAKDAPGEPTAATAALTGPTHAAATPAIAATGDAQQAPLDLHRENWPHAMVDRIEALRDAADAVSTKIRVVPDALGPIEMSVRKDGDTVHVHFAADQAQTRALLTDAQPRLQQIAEQRGLRLGGSSVDAGSGGAGQQAPQQQAAARQPAAPAPSLNPPVATAADDDTRIA